MASGTTPGNASGTIPGGASGTVPGSGAAPGAGAAKADLDENLASALAYLVGPLTGVLFLVLEPYNRNPTVRFHAFQSIFAWVAWIVGIVAMRIVTGFVELVPFVGWVLASGMWLALSGVGFVLWIVLMWKAYNKERWVLPIVGPLAEKQV